MASLFLKGNLLRNPAVSSPDHLLLHGPQVGHDHPIAHGRDQDEHPHQCCTHGAEQRGHQRHQQGTAPVTQQPLQLQMTASPWHLKQGDVLCQSQLLALPLAVVATTYQSMLVPA